jgi:transcriptional regulator with XRE-family HTH domain
MATVINEEYIRLLVSKNLKRLRVMQRFTQLGLAEKAGLTHNFINDLEKGKKGISSRSLAKLSNALNVEPYKFFIPEKISDDKMTQYISDFNDSLQKLTKNLTEKYTPSK